MFRWPSATLRLNSSQFGELSPTSHFIWLRSDDVTHYQNVWYHHPSQLVIRWVGARCQHDRIFPLLNPAENSRSARIRYLSGRQPSNYRVLTGHQHLLASSITRAIINSFHYHQHHNSNHITIRNSWLCRDFQLDGEIHQISPFGRCYYSFIHLRVPNCIIVSKLVPISMNVCVPAWPCASMEPACMLSVRVSARARIV